MPSISNFALIGAAGFVAPRHMRAIRDTGNRLVAATDRHDSVGVIDSFAPEARFFTEIERFDRHLEKLHRRDEDSRVHYVSICSPNHLHDAHCRLALRVGAHAICEKPLVLNPWNIDPLAEIEHETGKRVFTILQLRLHPVMIELKRELERTAGSGARSDIVLTYITRRGAWYHQSWKGDLSKSGGIATNIGIHFFDMLMWLFGPTQAHSLHLNDASRAAGVLELEKARVRWFLSVAEEDLPAHVRQAGGGAFRSLARDGQEIEFTKGFEDLHTLQYAQILAGDGFGLEDARASIELVAALRGAAVVPVGPEAHPMLR